MSESEIIKIDLVNGDKADILIAGDKPDAIQIIDASEASEYSEAPVQLREGLRYEYIIKSDSGTDYVLYADGGVVKSSNINASSGQIIPNTYVGTLRSEERRVGKKSRLW